MYLKALEIQGFKSFPEKTRLTFGSEITAIVGPNGSGKSNISDAILWVMGEQSTRALRGERMQDVIFGGTAARGAMGFAQVTLILDNSGGIFPREAAEVAISRKYYRSGESEYYVNREQVRLKDVVELLMDTGLGRDGYSIIGQGRITEIVAGRSEGRREVLEEAAGIARYRHRKEEAERRLARTDENLLRINDKIGELEMQVAPLREQAEVARRYLALRDELRELEISLWMLSLDKLHAQTEETDAELETSRHALEDAKRALEALYAESENLSGTMRARDVAAEEARSRLSREEAAAAACESAAAVLRTNIQNSAERVARMRAELAQQEDRARGLQEQIAARRGRVSEIDVRAKELEKQETAARNVAEGHRLRIANREAEAASVGDGLTKAVVDLRSTDGRISMLEEMEKEYEGFGKAVRTVMREAGRGVLSGVRGTVAELLRADDRCALAIETALGGAIQNLVVETQEDGRAAIELLKRRDAGRATFLPMETIRGGRSDRVPGPEAGCLGLAVDLVRFQPEYRPIFENLLGRTLVAETLGDAVALSRAGGSRTRIVTLDGQLINAGGSMTGGSAAKGTGILSRANELERLRAARGALAKRRDELSRRAEDLKRELGAARYALETAGEDLQAVRSEQSALAAEREATVRAADELDLMLRGMSGDQKTREAALKDIEAGTGSFRRELEAKEAERAEHTAEAEKVRAQITALTESRLEAEGRRTRTDKAAQEKNAAILELERACARLEQKKLAAEMEEKQIIDRLWDGYQLSHSAAQAARRPVENPAQANRRAGQLRQEMRALGTPNLGAIDEYARVRERYDYLVSQRDDVEKARGELIGVIADLTAEMKDIFTKEFAAINEAFGKVFTELFGGGRGELVLGAEGDILECDIDIRVQPPGKALTTLSLLSGGEMAFVAIALYFAILKVRPAPFCVMDEIEAALDESNVERFAAYMRRLSGQTQFIVITHRRGTMEEADFLYGVTMQEKGVSRVLELDLDEAEKHIGGDN